MSRLFLPLIPKSTEPGKGHAYFIHFYYYPFFPFPLRPSLEESMPMPRVKYIEERLNKSTERDISFENESISCREHAGCCQGPHSHRCLTHPIFSIEIALTDSLRV